MPRITVGARSGWEGSTAKAIAANQIVAGLLDRLLARRVIDRNSGMSRLQRIGVPPLHGDAEAHYRFDARAESVRLTALVSLRTPAGLY
jgi:hypothetical protein